MIDRPAYTEGRPARVAVPLTDLCRAPGGARDRQLLFGVEVTVIDSEDGWSFVESEDDYCGWVADASLTDSRPAVTHRVSAPATHVYLEPDIKRGEVMSLPLGARLAGTGNEGRFLRLAGGGFVPLVHVSDTPAADPVAVAESLIGTPYLWGGNSRWGIDCSGLVQVSLHACGIDCPGDSDQQFAELGEPVDDAPQRGDLVFWSGHVAMVAGPDRIIHANGHDMAVAFDGLRKVRARISAAGEGAFLGLRRLTG
ncbi:NLP/P60 hydrolase [Paracoccus sp. S-4012]|nr:NlpC/P60 family protein [Paracoccus sp. S-4012]MRX49321.1 NLP/P60 hydrolase [Paracoccus sp. S-4012]